MSGIRTLPEKNCTVSAPILHQNRVGVTNTLFPNGLVKMVRFSVQFPQVYLEVQLLPIQVESYAGHKADETPRRFLLEEVWIDVVEVLDRWHQIESLPEWPRANYFKVRGADKLEYLLKHDLEAEEWFLGRKWSKV